MEADSGVPQVALFSGAHLRQGFMEVDWIRIVRPVDVIALK